MKTILLKNRLEVEVYIIDICDIRLNTNKILLVELYDGLCSCANSLLPPARF